MKPGEGEFNINMQIRAKEVRLIAEGIEPGVYSIQRALEIADEQELDLVEISPNAEPPVCKVIDYKKFLFERRKKAKEA
ncbi:MAG: translation initiation factor IF-3, partial [Candidatus Methylacidiphilales bacterium]